MGCKIFLIQVCCPSLILLTDISMCTCPLSEFPWPHLVKSICNKPGPSLPLITFSLHSDSWPGRQLTFHAKQTFKKHHKNNPTAWNGGKWAPIILNGFHAPAIFTIFLNLFWILSRTTDEWCKLCVKMSVYWKKKMNLLLNSFVKYLNKNAISDILTNKICHNKSPLLV